MSNILIVSFKVTNKGFLIVKIVLRRLPNSPIRFPYETLVSVISVDQVYVFPGWIFPEQISLHGI